MMEINIRSSKNLLHLPGLVLLFMFLPSVLWADWYIVEKREDDFGNFSVQSMFIKGQKVRVEQVASAFIFDVENGRLTLLFPKQMVYWEGIHDSLALGLFDAIEDQMLSMMARLPESEQQSLENELKMMRDALGQDVPEPMLPPNTGIQKMDTTIEINGFKTNPYTFLIDSVVVEKLWITHDVSPYTSLSLKNLHQMMRIFSKPSLLSALRESSEWLDLLQQGLVIRSEIPQSPGKSRMQVETVREVTIPEAFFLPPEDYRKTGVAEVIRIMMGDDDPVPLNRDVSPLKPTPPGSLINKPGAGLGDD